LSYIPMTDSAFDLNECGTSTFSFLLPWMVTIHLFYMSDSHVLHQGAYKGILHQNFKEQKTKKSQSSF